jgi:hypothetical protein
MATDSVKTISLRAVYVGNISPIQFQKLGQLSTRSGTEIKDQSISSSSSAASKIVVNDHLPKIYPLP